jgi:hypothetical protein
MSDGADEAIVAQGVLQPASPLQGQVVAEEEGHDHRDGAFRLRAPPDLSREQLRSPLATPAKSPMTTTIPSAAIQDAADDSNDEEDEEPLSRRRPRRESVAAAAAAKVAASAPSLTNAQELVNWCIAQAVSVTTLPFDQAPPSVAAHVAAFSAAFQEQVPIHARMYACPAHLNTSRLLPCIAISTN